MQQLLDTPHVPPRATLVTGGTGLVGSLCAAEIVRRAPSTTVVLPVRAKWTEEQVIGPILDELRAAGVVDDAARARLIVVPLPDNDKMADLIPACRAHGVEEIVHCAGSVDYFNTAVLEAVNVELTRALLELGRAIGVGRFVFVSTAFSSGFRTDDIKEALHAAPEKDPTDYTKSKRDAEHLVATFCREAGVPSLILRPSIVVGDSVDGRYHGKPYGVYQFYAAGERLLLDKYHPELHVVAPRAPLPVLHQDAWKAGFFGAWKWAADGAVVHVVSRHATLPTMRDVLETWLAACVPFERVYVYEHLAEVPMAQLSRRQRMWAEFSAVNTEIALRRWAFETTTLEALRARGEAFADATPATLKVCLDAWLARSDRFQQHTAKYGPERAGTTTQMIDVPHDVAPEEGAAEVPPPARAVS